MTTRCSLLVAAVLMLGSSPAWSDDAPPGPPCVPGAAGRGGTVTEHSSRPGATFVIHLTGQYYQDLGLDIHPPSIPDGAGGTTIVPVVVPAMPGLCDARNETFLPSRSGGPGGPRADLSIESVHFVEATQTWELLNIWGTIAQQVGNDVLIAIPDLYASDASGALDGVTLYSLVDLAIFLKDLPAFTEGQVFDIVNGQTAALPGMYFSTDPFTFDPATGFSDPPYTGTAIALTEHGFASLVPEPAPVALLALGALVLLRGKRLQA
jgi:hypothetical protein